DRTDEDQDWDQADEEEEREAGAEQEAVGFDEARHGSPALHAQELELPEEVSAVAAEHLDPTHLVLAHHLEDQALPGLVPPEPRVEVAAARHLLRVQRDDQVALLQAAPIARAVGYHAGHDHALLDRVGEDTKPGTPVPGLSASPSPSAAAGSPWRLTFRSARPTSKSWATISARVRRPLANATSIDWAPITM